MANQSELPLVTGLNAILLCLTDESRTGLDATDTGAVEGSWMLLLLLLQLGRWRQ